MKNDAMIFRELDIAHERIADAFDGNRVAMSDAEPIKIVDCLISLSQFDITAGYAQEPPVKKFVGYIAPLIVFYRREIDRLKAELEAKG